MSTTTIILIISTFVLLLQVCSVHSTSPPINKTNIYIGVILSFDKSGYKQAIKLLQECIANSSDLKYFSDRYELQVVEKWDYAYEYYTIKHCLQMSENDENTPVAFLGFPSSTLVPYAAVALDPYKFLIVTITDYENIHSKGNILSSSSGSIQEIKAKIQFLKTFKWKRVGLLYSLWKSVSQTNADKMVDAFKSLPYPMALTGIAGIEIRETKLENNLDVLRGKLEQLKKNDTKIFIAEIDPYEALVLFCEVYKLKIYGDDIVWILSSNTKTFDDWIGFNNTRTGRIVSCSKEDIETAINGAWVFDGQLIREDNKKTASGLTADKYLDRLIQMGAKGDRDSIAKSSLVFDGLWAIVTTLNNSIEELAKKNISLSMNSNSNRKEMIDLQKHYYKKMKTVDFEGIAGPYSYSDSINKDGAVKLMHYHDNAKLEKVGEFNTKTKNLTFLNDTKYLWGAAGVPKDRSQIVDEVLKINRGLYIAMTTLASIGIFLGIMFLTFNLVYGKYKFIKLSAPLFNNIIACGCLLCLVSVFLFGVHDIDKPEKNFALVCKARAWTLSVGFSCAFGAMFVKTWRIYKICTNKKLRVKLGPLSNWYLLSLIGGIILVDIIILITWELVDPLIHGIQVIVAKKPHATNNYLYYKEILNVCQSNQMVVWLSVIYVYKGVLILYGLFLAYETRNVIYAHLNDSRVIGICVYNVVVLSVVGAFLSLLLEYKNYQEMYIVLSVCITLPAVATICLMMFPKIAYRCKTDNLDDTETIANGMSTVRNSFDVSTMHTPQIHVTTPAPLEPAPIQPASSPKDAKFSYSKEVSDSNSNGVSELSVQNGVAKQL